MGIENLAVPDLVDRKGSLWLKSNHMYYGKRTLNSDWHAAREAEPKVNLYWIRIFQNFNFWDQIFNAEDSYLMNSENFKDYDVAMASDQERNQHLATYKRIGNDPPTIPKSTMHAGLEDALTSRRDYEAKKKNPVSLFVAVSLEKCMFGLSFSRFFYAAGGAHARG